MYYTYTAARRDTPGRVHEVIGNNHPRLMMIHDRIRLILRIHYGSGIRICLNRYYYTDICALYMFPSVSGMSKRTNQNIKIPDSIGIAEFVIICFI